MSFVLIIGGAIILFIGLFPVILGFRHRGIAGGSCASCWQSHIGKVKKKSCFAKCTSFAMRGIFFFLIILGIILIGFGVAGFYK